jgi:hypothetical protein
VVMGRHGTAYLASPEAASNESDAGGSERRRDFRRELPFGRGAVLKVGDRSHIVGLADVSVSGAYLTTRAPVSVGETHELSLLMLPDHVEIALRVEIVRVAQQANESKRHLRGVAVRFLELDSEMKRRLNAFVSREPMHRRA